MKAGTVYKEPKATIGKQQIQSLQKMNSYLDEILENSKKGFSQQESNKIKDLLKSLDDYDKGYRDALKKVGEAYMRGYEDGFKKAKENFPDRKTDPYYEGLEITCWAK